MASYVAIYYMPFYFQAGLGHSPLKSGVDYISLAVPQMIGLLAGGAITTATGHYIAKTVYPHRRFVSDVQGDVQLGGSSP